MFYRDTRGTIAISSAVGGLVMVAAIGVAFDTSRMVGEHHTLQSVADAAALAAMSPEGISDGKRKSIVNATVDDYMRQTGETLAIHKPDVTVKEGREVAVRLTATTDLIFGGVVGMSARDVSANATAEETLDASNAGALGGISLSFVMDLSSSMESQMGRETKLDMVRSSLNEVLGNAQGPVDTGLYPFEWGAVDERTTALQPGTAEALRNLAYAQTSEGSVPTTAMEFAVADQRNDRDADPDKPRYVVFITDGAVDVDKSDERGQMVRSEDFFPNDAPPKCMQVSNRMERAHNELAAELDKAMDGNTAGLPSWTPGQEFDDDDLKYDSADSPAEGYAKRVRLLEIATDVMNRDTPFGAAAISAPNLDMDDVDDVIESFLDNVTNLGEDALEDRAEDVEGALKQARKLHKEMVEFDETCKPAQEQRVLDSCETSRKSGIPVVAVDMSGGNADAAELTQQCVFGVPDSTTTTDDRTRFSGDANAPASAIPDNIEPGRAYTADDGSIYLMVDDKASLKQVLTNLMPQTQGSQPKPERRVRLVR